MRADQMFPSSSEANRLSNSFTLSAWIKKHESWKAFGLKAFLIMSLLYALGAAFSARFVIAGDPQTIRCIPGYDVYLVDKFDREPERGGLFVFLSKDLSPVYGEGTKMLKYMRGMPGDTVEVRSNDQVFINDLASEYGLVLATEKLGLPASKFYGKTTLKENEYWFLGTSPRSFDSRYWGAVTRDQIVGRAYPLF